MDFDDFFGPSTTTPVTTTAPSNSNAASSSSFDLDDFLMSSSPSPAQNSIVGQMHTTPTTINNFMNHTQPIQHQQPSEDFDDDFGDFQEGMEELPQTTTKTHSPIIATTRTITPTPTSMDMTTTIPTFTDQNNHNKFDDLFSSSPVNTAKTTTTTTTSFNQSDNNHFFSSSSVNTTATATETNNNDNNEDFGDFGDFGDFEQPVEETTITSTATIPPTHNNNNDNMMMNDDDDDTFFSSPSSNPTTTTTKVTTAKTVKPNDDIMSFFDNDTTTTTTTTVPLSSSSSSSSLFMTNDNNDVHHHHQKQQKEEEEQQSQSFEANFDDDWGDFVEPTNTTTTTTPTTATFTTINNNGITVNNVNNDEVMKEKEEKQVKEQDNFEFQVNFDQEQSNSDDQQEKQEEKKVNMENAENEEKEEDDLIKEPVGTDEGAIFNRLIFHERFKDAQHFISNTESMMTREKMDHFKLQVWRSLLRLSDDDMTRQNENGTRKELEQKYVKEFEKKKLNIDTLNHGSRRLLIPMVNWQVSHEKFVSVSIVPQLHPTVQLVIQGLKEVESCVQLFDTIRLEKEREIEVVEQLFRSEKLNQFLRGVIEVYTMIELCLLELRSRTEAAAAVMSSRRRFDIEQFCDIVQNRLIGFRDLCQQVKTEMASQTSSTQLLEQVGRGTVVTLLFVASEAGNGGDGSRRCCLTGRRLSPEKNELGQFEQFGPVYAPYRKYYSQRIRTLN